MIPHLPIKLNKDSKSSDDISLQELRDQVKSLERIIKQKDGIIANASDSQKEILVRTSEIVFYFLLYSHRQRCKMMSHTAS